VLSLPSSSQKPGGGCPSRCSYSDKFLELKLKSGVRGYSKEGVWCGPNDTFHACYFQVLQKCAFRAHETTPYQKDALCPCTCNLQPEVSAGHRKEKTHLAAEWRNIILGFQSQSGSGRLLRELAPTRLHVLFCVFLKVDVSRARDDRFRGPETSRNSKPPKVGVSRRRNTCLWEAISTNVQNFVQPEAEPHKGLAMAWQMPRQDVFLRHLDHRVHFSHPGRICIGC
jgi:hypothetical protein